MKTAAQGEEVSMTKRMIVKGASMRNTLTGIAVGRENAAEIETRAETEALREKRALASQNPSLTGKETKTEVAVEVHLGKERGTEVVSAMIGLAKEMTEA